MSRVEASCRAVLVIAPSHLRRTRPGRSDYKLQIGNGLFSTVPYKPGNHIVNFVGEVIRDVNIVNEKTAAGRGGYLLGTTGATNMYLDCNTNAKRGLCLASMANCPYRCRNAITGNHNPQANAKLCIYFRTGHDPVWSLKCTTIITAGTELLWSYGPDYQFPTFYD